MHVRSAHAHVAPANVNAHDAYAYLVRSEDHRRLGGRGGALEACRKLGGCDKARLEACRRGLGSDRRLGGCGSVRDAVNPGSGGGLYAAKGHGVERCRRFGHRRRCRRHLRHRSRGVRHRDLGSQLKRLRAGCLGLGLVVLDEDKAIDLDSVNGAGEPMEREALGTRVGACVSKGAWLGDQLGLDSNCNMCMCMCM